jgi:putative ABC transport system permease protein
MNKYKNKISFKIDMPWWIFVLVGVLVFAISIITVGYQSWRSATQNPIKSLKYK